MSSDQITYIFWGILTTVNYTLVGVFFGFFISLPISLMHISKYKVLQFLAKSYMSVIRRVPVFLQLIFWYFALPQMSALKLSTFFACSITFAINSSAYLAEVLKSSITSIEIGQIEAAKVLGITKRDTFFDIVLPQIVSNLIPGIVNEILSLVKETAIIGFIGITDITRRAQLVSIETYDFLGPIVVAAAGYYCLTLTISGIYAIITRRKDIINNAQPSIPGSEEGK